MGALLPIGLGLGMLALLFGSSGAKAASSSPATPSKKKKKPKPPSTAASSSSSSTLPTAPVTLENPPAPPEPTKPKPVSAADLAALGAAMKDPTDAPKQPTKKQSAQELYDYVVRMLHEGRGSQLGTKGAPNATIQRLQKAIGQINADGIYGDKTRARGKELLGREFPPRSNPKARVSPTPAPPALPPPIGPRPGAPTPSAARPAPPTPAARPSTPMAPQVEILPAVIKRTPKQAAEDLLAYVKQLKSENRMSQLGSKGSPSAIVLAAQKDMGGMRPADVDGIYALATRTRGKELLGVTFPPRA